MSSFSVPLSEAMTAQAVDGEVVILGPNALAMSMTPDAAEESARRLIAAAAEARRHPGKPD